MPVSRLRVAPFPQIKISHTLIYMRRSLCALAFVLILTGAVSGCAGHNTYEKCGFYGCPGDAKITADVLAKFSQRRDLEPNAITVQTLDHVVYLYGLVSSSLEIGTAEAIARKVPGVTGVVNSVAAETR
jgi:hyperosmotically inducible periplasmic protein